jgi:hypothetical protein
VTEDGDVALDRVLVLVLRVERELHSHLVPGRFPSANPHRYGQEGAVHLRIAPDAGVPGDTVDNRTDWSPTPWARHRRRELSWKPWERPPAFAGYRTSVLANGKRCLTDGRCFAIGKSVLLSPSAPRPTYDPPAHSHSSPPARQKDLKSR